VIVPDYNGHSLRLTAPRLSIKGSNTRAFSQLSLRVLFIATIRLCWRWLMMMVVT